MTTSSWVWPERYTGELCLNAAHPGLVYRGYRAICPLRQIEVRVPLRSTAIGMVIDASGQPIAGHGVYVYLAGKRRLAPVYLRQTGTMTLVQPLVTTASGSLPGWITNDQELDVYDPLTGVTVWLGPLWTKPLDPGSERARRWRSMTSREIVEELVGA